MLARKMSGSINYIDESQLKQPLQKMLAVLEGYDLIKILADDDAKEIKKEIVEQDVNGIKVQTVIGKNFRINCFEDDTIEFIFQIKAIVYEIIESYREVLMKLGISHKTTHKSVGGVLSMKSIVTITNEIEEEDIVKLFTLFNIE